MKKIYTAKKYVFEALLFATLVTNQLHAAQRKQFLYQVPRVPTTDQRQDGYIHGPAIRLPQNGAAPMWKYPDRSFEATEDKVPVGFRAPKTFTEKETVPDDDQEGSKGPRGTTDSHESKNDKDEQEDEFLRSLDQQILQKKEKQIQQIDLKKDLTPEQIKEIISQDPILKYKILSNQEIAIEDGFEEAPKTTTVSVQDEGQKTKGQSIILQEETFLQGKKEKERVQKELMSIAKKRDKEEEAITKLRVSKTQKDFAEQELFRDTTSTLEPTYEEDKKIIYYKTKKQLAAERIGLPDIPEIKRNYWKIQSLPPNIAQKVYKESNTHLTPVVFQFELDFEAIGLTQNSSKLPDLRAMLSTVSSVNVQTESGNTLLMYSIANRNIDAVILLIQHGANINMANRYGMTALHLASYMRDTKSATILLQYGAETDVLDGNGMTPLMYAITHRDVNMIDILLQNGADVDSYNEYGVNSIQVAKEYGESGLVKYLKSFSVRKDEDVVQGPEVV